MPELIVIFLVALLIFGPRKLPEIGKTIGKGLSEFKRASDDLKRTIEEEIEDGKREVATVRQDLNSVSAGLSGVLKSAPDPVREADPEPPPVAPDSRPIQPS